MIKYLEALQNLPEEIKIALIKAFEYFKEEISEVAKKSDFNELKTIVKELAEAQKRTENELNKLSNSFKIITK